MNVIEVKNGKIQEFRLRRGLTLDKMSKLAGISYGTAYNIENKKTIPTPTTAKKIYEALGTSFDELFQVIEKEGE